MYSLQQGAASLIDFLTIVKNRSRAVVKGGLTKDFGTDASLNVAETMTQAAFNKYMAEVRDSYKITKTI